MSARKPRRAQGRAVDSAGAPVERKALAALGADVTEMIKANAGLLFAGIATFILMGAGQSVYGPALPAFAREFGLTTGEAGWLVSAHWIGCALGVAAMYLAGAAITPRVALAQMGGGAVVVALGLGWWATLGGAVVFGAGYGMATATFNPRVLQTFGRRGPSMLSLLNATFGIGAIVAPLAFVALGGAPQAAFAAIAGLCALIWLGAGPAGRVGAVASAGPVRPFRPHWPILAFGMAAIGTEACLIGLGPTALIAAGESEVRAAGLLSAFFLAFLAARIGLIFVAHRLPSFTLYLVAVGGAAVSALGAAVVSPGACFVALGWFAGMFFPGFYVTAARKMGEDSRVPPTIIAAGLVGGIFAPMLLAPALEGAGDRGFFWVVAGWTGLLALAALPALRAMNRPGP